MGLAEEIQDQARGRLFYDIREKKKQFLAQKLQLPIIEWS
jgi:hypothetical protein